MPFFRAYLLACVAILAVQIDACPAPPDAPPGEDGFERIVSGLSYRSIGPYRGGRSAACAGVPGQPRVYYFGAAGGGVWKTVDGGARWNCVSDGFFGGSIGAVAVAPADANIVYVGGGEVTVRGNVSHGSGMFKSSDAGRTWQAIGLEDSHCIPRIRIDPRDANIVYAAVLGHLYGPNQQRGVFKSEDGGKSWRRVLFVNDEAGAVDLVIDPSNSRTLYAATWKVRRTPYSLESGGAGSGLWKSVDAGETWTEITRRPGLPDGGVGICGITVSPVNTDRVWAIVEAEKGGVFRSDDAGETWTRVNEERKLRQRAWYYTRIYAGPRNADEVYVLNVGFFRSADGGKTFASIRTPHGDHHDLWIAPEDADRLVIADDGGGQVSLDRGKNWSTYLNQPTAQFYRVTTDDHFPYRIYGAQQDNSTVRISHRSGTGAITEADWEPTAGGESGHIAPDPVNPDIVYGGSYGGYLTRLNHATGERRNVHVWPDNPMGSAAGANKYRFQWNFPIFFSPHDPQTLYAAANVLFKTSDEGQSWQAISPDLTRSYPPRLGASGGPITKDNTSVEYYCTIFAALESPHEPGVLWAGSDDGLLHVSKDAGRNWTNVSPPSLPEWSQINSLEAHPTEKGGLYVAATRYKSDDFKPYLFKTVDYGQTWTEITEGIDRKHFTRVVRADPERPGLLFAGTEAGLYRSLDDGVSWRRMQLNLPVVPITDLAIKEDDLIVATQGRSFWILDDLVVLRQWSPKIANKTCHVFAPAATVRLRGNFRGGSSGGAGQDLPAGVRLQIYLREELEPDADMTLEFLDADGHLVRRYSQKPDKEAGEGQLKLEAGLNQFVWDTRYPDAESFDGLIMWSGGTRGPLAAPGKYMAKFSCGEDSQDVPFEIQPDPRSSAEPDDYRVQLRFLLQVRDKLSSVHETIAKIREIRLQVEAYQKRVAPAEPEEESNDIVEACKSVVAKLTTIEETLYQTKNRSAQDPLNYPIRLNDKLSGVANVVATGDFRPTAQAISVRDELVTQIDEQLNAFAKLLDTELKQLNELIYQKQIPAIFVPE